MNRNRGTYYITTAIDYANGPPHMGHALEKIGADVMARYHERRGEAAHFVIGMDEHGLKVLQSAREAGVSPGERVDEIAELFLSAWDRLSIRNDDFIRTTQPRHRRAVEAMIARMRESGDLYRDSYAGYYCVGCEAFKREDELEGDVRLPETVEAAGGESDAGPGGTEPGDASGAGVSGSTAAEGGTGRVVEGVRCPIHPSRDILWTEETNWFFRLSKYQMPLLDLYERRPGFVRPEIRLNEVRNVVAGGLDDISVSRTRLPWGIPWPDDPDQTVYVWIDALTNYLSAIGFPDDEYRRYWPAAVHVIGKDITRFHCIYWPAMLMSAGVELPGTVWAHGFLSYEGRRLSKSEGVWVELDDAIDRHGPDALRYYLLRDVPWDGDGDFSWDRFDARYTAELANDIGNLVNRVISMIDRYRDGTIPAAEPMSLDDAAAEMLDRYATAMDANLLQDGTAAALELASEANGFVETRAPWQQAKDPDQAAALDETLGSLARTLAILACMLEPFMPNKMSVLAESMGLDAVPSLPELEGLDIAGHEVQTGRILFPRE